MNFLHVSENAFFSKDNKLNVIQIFEKINSKSFPALHPDFAISLNFNGGKGFHKVLVEIISDEDNNKIAEIKKDVEITKEKGMANFIAKVIGLIFPEEGKYKIKVSIDNDFVNDSNYITLTKENGR